MIETDISAREFSYSVRALEKSIGPRAHVTVVITHSEDAPPLRGIVYPTGFNTKGADFSVTGESFAALLENINTKWAEYAAEHRTHTIRKMALEIIRITAELGECSDAAAVTGLAQGLVAEIERKVSVTERHMVIKVWRALWKKMAAMKYCDLGQDPGKSFANTPPLPRDQIWARWEVLKLVQMAWRHEYYGLAALMAVAWDSQLSPIDNRSLTPGQARSDSVGIYFALPRAKTGRAAAATLTTWSQAIMIAYLKKLGAELLDNTPLFWTRGGKPLSRKGETGQWGGDHGGGRHVVARPYSKSALNKDFRTIRELAFGRDETRQRPPLRRSRGGRARKLEQRASQLRPL